MSILGYDDMVMWHGYSCGECGGRGYVGLGNLTPCMRCQGYGFDSYEGGTESATGTLLALEPFFSTGTGRWHGVIRRQFPDHQREVLNIDCEGPLEVVDELVNFVLHNYRGPFTPLDLRGEVDSGAPL